MNFDALINETEALLRSGNREQARAKLLAIKGETPPRSKVVSLAALARRTGMLELALQIMNPIIRPKTKLDTPATPEEVASYGLILLGFGAIQECRTILRSSDQKNPDVLMAQAFAAIKTWDYTLAMTYLNSYIESPRPSDYLKMVAKVNLAASQIATGEEEQLEAGNRLVNEILRETEKQGWSVLNSNAVELSIQIAVQKKDWAKCDNLLRDADLKTESSGPHFKLFVQKWRAIAELMRTDSIENGLGKLRTVRQAARDLGHWETMRDCDFHEAIATKNSLLAQYVYFGTPFQSYQKRLREATSSWLVLPEIYDYRFTVSNDSSECRTFQLVNGSERGNPNIQLPIGKSLHLALQILVSDFYRPFSIGTLFSNVFPNEHFNPSASPKRVSFIIHRLRTWFEESSIPLDIVSNRDGYRLIANGDYCFEISSIASASSNLNQSMLDRLKAHVRTSRQAELSVHEVASALEISERSARYFLKWATEENLALRTGTGRSIRYRF